MAELRIPNDESQTPHDWMPAARAVVAQAWCDPETEKIEMDTVLGEAMAKRLALWLEMAAQMARNADFYRGLLEECAKHLGDEVFVADDGSVMDDPLLLKVPVLVAALAARGEWHERY